MEKKPYSQRQRFVLISEVVSGGLVCCPYGLSLQGRASAVAAAYGINPRAMRRLKEKARLRHVVCLHLASCEKEKPLV